MKLTIDIGAWNSDLVMEDLQKIFKFDCYTVSLKDKSISLNPTAWREFPRWIQGNLTNEIHAAETPIEPEQPKIPDADDLIPGSAEEQVPAAQDVVTIPESPDGTIPEIDIPSSRPLTAPAPKSASIIGIKDGESLEAICPNCGKKFIKKAINQKYCCGTCKRSAAWKKEAAARGDRPRKPVDPNAPVAVRQVVEGSNGARLICPECGKEFVPTSARQVFCSVACRNLAKRKRLGLVINTEPLPPRECPICHKIFTPTRPNAVYCSNDCKRRNEYQRLAKFRAQKEAQRASRKDDSEGRPAVTLVASSKTAPSLKAVPLAEQVSLLKPTEVETGKSYDKTCELCGMTFKTTNKFQRFCKPCLDSFGEEECAQLVLEEAEKKKAIEAAAKVRFKVCPRCGHNFEAKNPAKEFFCPTCVERAMKAPLLQKGESES